MRLGGEDRAQSVQVGVIVLFGFLIVALSMYQATIVPQQNAEVEFRHNQAVQDDLVGLGNSIDATGRVGDAAPAAVKLGTRYPSRTFFVNPAPAAGTLRTEPAGNVTVSGVKVLSTTGNEANDYWGTDRNFSTNSVVYEPRYNQYDEAPVTRYEAGGVVNDFGGRTLAVDDQTIVDGNRITLVAVDGTLSRNGVQLLSVDPAAISSVDRRETVTGDIRLVVPSTASADVWADDLLAEEIAAGWVNGTTQVGSDRVRIDLNASRNYALGVAGVGVGRNVTATSAPAYIDVERAPAAADAGSVREVVVEVRDGYGNPVGNQQVTGAVTGGSGSLVSGTVTTDDRGRAVFEYEAAGSGTATIRFSYDGLGSFDASAPEDAEHSLAVGSGGGTGSGGATYDLVWDTDRIDDTNGVTYVAGNDTIVVDPSVASSPIPMTSRATNDDVDPIDGASVDYSTADSSVAGFSGPNSAGETGSDGRSTVDMEFGNGKTAVYATGGSGGDSLTVEVGEGSQGGVYYRYYEGDYGGTDSYMPNFDAQTPVETGTVDTFDIGPRNRDDDFGFSYTAYIDVPEGGTYTFYTNSDDGSRLFIDGQRVVDNPGEHQERERSGQIALSEGQHDITVTYYENGGEQVLDVSWAGPGFGKEGIPTNVLTPRVPDDDGNGAGDGGSSAGRTELVDGSGESFWGGEGVAFGVRNTGNSQVSISRITVNGTSRSSVTRISEGNGGDNERGQHEVYIDGSDSGILDMDGTPYYDDAGTPLSLGQTEPLTEAATVDGGTAATVDLYAFRNSGGNAVSMSGQTVTVTLHFSDGSSGTYQVQVS